MSAAPALMIPDKIRVMVVDDSVIARGLVGRLIDAQPDMVVVGSASHGEMALFEIRRREVDLVILDIEMPVMDGITALPLLLAERPGLKVLMASTLTRRNSEISLKALQLGAADYLAKPQAVGGVTITPEDFQRELLAKIRALAPSPGAPVVQQVVRPCRKPSGSAPVEVVAIGGSTGAPPVLVKLFEQLGPSFRPPVLITQHMPVVFTTLLAEQIGRAGGRPCAEGRDGEPIVPGRTYVAPGGWHMRVVREQKSPVIRLDQAPPEHFCRPAVDPLFRSVAETYGRNAMAVLLTGMGADGAKGCEAISAAGGRFVVQDEATSAVWGMPGAGARTGLAEKILPDREIAAFLTTAVEAC